MSSLTSSPRLNNGDEALPGTVGRVLPLGVVRLFLTLPPVVVQVAHVTGVERQVLVGALVPSIAIADVVEAHSQERVQRRQLLVARLQLSLKRARLEVEALERFGLLRRDACLDVIECLLVTEFEREPVAPPLVVLGVLVPAQQDSEERGLHGVPVLVGEQDRELQVLPILHHAALSP